ncbi:GNAT family N-acetyltransferase [Martelella alba]|uniref:GNAT family N-acetyltransferase n=1 Tax=Martelella alba TaxID=2590451 RepID=A0A506UDK4_9HYPH|nr:GNAT family N-acetyltransferase [Martelella alba]TPW31486.1 GNAT family N-acetyltransferase [Martelella alba]
MIHQPFEIRRFRAADTEALCRIWHDASLRSHDFLPEALLFRQRRIIAERFLGQTECWIAACDETPLGFIGLIDDFVGGLFVDPHCQGYGVGTALLGHAWNLRGKLALEVYARNSRAIAFYRRHGFSGIRRRETDDNGLPFALILMQKGMTTARPRRYATAKPEGWGPVETNMDAGSAS